MNYKKDTQKGKYTLMNPTKYMGTKAPVYKSKWEKKVFHAMDKNPYVSCSRYLKTRKKLMNQV